MLADKDLRKVLPGLSRIDVHGPWYRAVDYDYLLKPPPGAPSGSPVQPLWPGGSRVNGVRFTPRDPHGFESLYLALDEITALLEVTQVLKPAGSPVPLFFGPQVMMTVDGILHDILDVTAPAIQSALGTSDSELTGHWAYSMATFLTGKGAMPPTQALGKAAIDVGGIVGLKYRSSKSVASATASAIVVFTDRLMSGRSSLELFNKPTGSLKQRLP